MIFQNFLPKLKEAIHKAKALNEPQELRIIYNEIVHPKSMDETFNFLYVYSINFEVVYEEFRLLLIIKPPGINSLHQGNMYAFVASLKE